MLFELYHDPLTNTNTSNIVNRFGHQELYNEWKFLSLCEVGITTLQDDQIYEWGTSSTLCLVLWGMDINYKLTFSITTTHKNFHGYTNNCQNFVRYLLEYVCPGLSAPQTLKELVEGLSKHFFWACLSTPVLTFNSIPGAYLRSSSGSNWRSGHFLSSMTLGSIRT